MSQDYSSQVTLQEELLAYWTHSIHNCQQVKGRAKEAYSNQASYEGIVRATLSQVPYEKVSAQAEANEVQRPVRKITFDSFHGYFKLVESQPDKGHRTGHFNAESSVIDAHKGAIHVLGGFGHNFNIATIGPASHAMAGHHHRSVAFLFNWKSFVDPVETDVTPVWKEDLFSLVLHFLLGGDHQVKGLQIAMCEVGCVAVFIGRMVSS